MEAQKEEEHDARSRVCHTLTFGSLQKKISRTPDASGSGISACRLCARDAQYQCVNGCPGARAHAGGQLVLVGNIRASCGAPICAVFQRVGGGKRVPLLSNILTEAKREASSAIAVELGSSSTTGGAPPKVADPQGHPWSKLQMTCTSSGEFVKDCCLCATRCTHLVQ